MKATDVFTPGKAPTITFVDEHLKARENALRDALEQGGMLVSLSGPSKSGKTVFVKSVLGSDYVVSITGAGVNSPDDLWERVFHVIGTFVAKSVTITKHGETKAGGHGEIEGNAIFVKGRGGVTLERTNGESGAVTSDATTSHLGVLVKEMAGSGMTIFVDDFHYVAATVQEETARQIKEAIASGVQVICASVPYRSEDVLRANPDLRGRVVGIDFDYWDTDTLTKIGSLGFSALNVNADPKLLSRLANEAAGSPQLMQALCLNACFETGIREKQKDQCAVQFSEDLLKIVCARTAQSADYSSTLERLREGPKTRGTERKQYRLRDGTVGDVYTILLQAMAKDPPNLHFTYADLQQRIELVCEEETPVGSSVTGSCEHIALRANDGQVRDIIEWDSTVDVLDIRDPYLLFYMRWGG